MSTKIYHAYFVPGTEREAFQAITEDLRPKIRKEAKARLAMHMGNDSYFDYRKRLIEDMRSGLNSPANVAFIAVIYSAPEPRMAITYAGNSWCLVQFFGVSGDMEHIVKWFARRNGWFDYHYQDQSDKPARVTRNEWKERQYVWERVMERSDIPYELGMFVEIVNLDWAQKCIFEIAGARQSESRKLKSISNG